MTAQTITDYASLVAAITEYLAREEDTTLINRIPTFIQLAEAKFNRELRVRQMEQRATALVLPNSDEPEYISLPLDFQSMRRVRISSIDCKPELTFLSVVQADEYRTSRGNTKGRPRHFTIFGTEIELIPTPDSDYTIEMIYRQNVPALSSDTATNWLLTFAPDAYLYGALLEAAPYIKDDDRIQVWGSALVSTLDSISKLGMTSTFNAGPLAVRSNGATP